MNVQNATPKAYRQAITTLKRGGLVVMPTETVYGLAALAKDDGAIRALFRAKGRRFDKPLSLAVWSQDMLNVLIGPAPLAQTHAQTLAQTLAGKLWPGPLTLVMPLSDIPNISPLCNHGGDTIGVRYPDIGWAKAFQDAGFFEPIALTSANRAGAPAPTTAAGAATQVGSHVDLVIDGGASALGMASTVIEIKNERGLVLREGSLSPDRLAPYPIDFPVDLSDPVKLETAGSR